MPTNEANPIDIQFGVKFGKEFGVKFGVKFGVNEKRLLILLDESPEMSAQDAAGIIGISKRGIEKQLKKLKDIGTISRQGSDKNGIWVINK